MGGKAREDARAVRSEGRVDRALRPRAAVQDTAIQESMGPIYDRTKEHLGTSDTAIIAARRMLMKAARNLSDTAAPPGLDPAGQRVRAASIVLPRAVPFQEGAKDMLVAQPGTLFVSA